MISAVSGWFARARRHELLLAAALFGSLVALFFSPIVRHDASYSSIKVYQDANFPWKLPRPPSPALRHDQPEFLYPRQVFVHERLTKGDIPLWNPMTFSGHPFLAETGSRLAYPPYLAMSWLLDPTWMHDLYIVGHVFVAGMAAFALMKSLGTRFGGAALSGVAWAFSSYALLYYSLEMFAPVAALLPLVVLLVRRAHERRSTPHLLGASLLLGAMVLGTSAELALLSTMAVSAYAGTLALRRLASEWKGSTWRRRAAELLRPAAFGAAATAVAAVALIPFLELSGRSDRTATTYSFLEKNVPVRPSDFLRAFWPPAFPLTLRSALSQQVFLGTATAVLALVALFRRRPGTGLGRALTVVIFAIVATPLARVGYQVVPGLKSLNGFGRSLFLWDLGLAVLAGIGLDGLLHRGREPDDAPDGARDPAGPRRRLSAAPWAAVVAGSVILATSWQLFDYGRSAERFQARQAKYFLPPTPATEALRTELGNGPGRSRTLPVTAVRPSGLLVPTASGATAMALDLPSASGYEPVLPDRTSTAWRVLRGEPVDSALTVPLAGTLYATNFAYLVRTDLLGRMGVTAILAPPDLSVDATWRAVPLSARGLRETYTGPDGTVLEVLDPVPRATFVDEAVMVGSGDDALRQFTDPAFDAHRQVVLEGDPASTTGRRSTADPTGDGTPSEIEWLVDDPDRLRLSVQAAEPGWLVLLDSWDPGWRATVNGRSAEVRQANYSFRAVAVPAGSSTVTFRYEPATVRVAGSITVASSVAIVGFLTWAWARRKRRSTATGATEPPPQSQGPGR